MVEEVRDLADDFDEVRRTQGQPTLERVIEKPGDDQDTDDAGREARSDGYGCHPVLNRGERYEQRQHNCEGDQHAPQRDGDAATGLEDPRLALRVCLRQKRQNLGLLVLLIGIGQSQICRILDQDL